MLARLGLSSNAEYEKQTERDLINARRGLEEVLGALGDLLRNEEQLL